MPSKWIHLYSIPKNERTSEIENAVSRKKK